MGGGGKMWRISAPCCLSAPSWQLHARAKASKLCSPSIFVCSRGGGVGMKYDTSGVGRGGGGGHHVPLWLPSHRCGLEPGLPAAARVPSLGGTEPPTPCRGALTSAPTAEPAIAQGLIMLPACSQSLFQDFVETRELLLHIQVPRCQGAPKGLPSALPSPRMTMVISPKVLELAMQRQQMPHLPALEQHNSVAIACFSWADSGWLGRMAHLECLGVAGGVHPPGVLQLPPQLPHVFPCPAAVHHHHLYPHRRAPPGRPDVNPFGEPWDYTATSRLFLRSNCQHPWT